MGNVPQKKSTQTKQNEMYFNINEVAHIIDVVPATIRNWEKAGLFTAKRKGNNYRVFDFNDIELLKKIKKYSTEESMNMALIKKMLEHDVVNSPTNKRHFSKEIYHSKLKAYREKNSYTLEDVSRLTGISASYLSRIEQGQCSVSLDIFKKITAFYGESILTFFDLTQQPTNTIFRAGEGIKIESSLKGVETLSLCNKTSVFHPVFFTVATGCGDFNSHCHPSGYEFIYIISGKLQMTLDDTETFLLKTGDSINFDSTRMHNWHNAGKNTLEFIWVHTSI